MPEFDSSLEYRPIAGFPGYCVGSDGSVWSQRQCFSLDFGEWKPATIYRRPREGRYCVVCLRATPNGKLTCRYVHRLVLEAFVGKCPKGMWARHFPDRDTSNNRLDNLSWATAAQNHADKKVHGTQPRGEKCHNAKLRREDIATIFSLHRQGVQLKDIAKGLGVSPTAVSNVVRGHTWAWLQAEPVDPKQENAPCKTH